MTMERISDMIKEFELRLDEFSHTAYDAGVWEKDFVPAMLEWVRKSEVAYREPLARKPSIKPDVNITALFE